MYVPTINSVSITRQLPIQPCSVYRNASLAKIIRYLKFRIITIGIAGDL